MRTDFFGGLGSSQQDEHSLYKTRRKELVSAIKEQHSHITKGAVVLFAAFETGSQRFRQDKTFYYYTGITEPGTAVVIELDGKTTLYRPHCYAKRTQWMEIPQALVEGNAKTLGVDECAFLGNECDGYGIDSYFSFHEYEHMLAYIKAIVEHNGSLFTTLPDNGHEYLTTRLVINHLQTFIPNVQTCIVDISSIVARNRRRKDVGEIEKIYRAIEVTELAHEAATQAIKNNVTESEVQASIEYIMTAARARIAFPSIVGSGKNSTVLHYSENKGAMRNGDLVVVDIGAELDNYCADLTRTYPVSGTFTKRQKEIYNTVLETQNYIAELAKPGMWLKNAEKSQQSLHHLAQQFLKKRGYADYFPHGIGHYLGLDVHDVGDYNTPLHEGDVITIEPGIYISQEDLGVRIEDNYWITKDGAVCLSENLPKEAHDIEDIMQQALSDNKDEDDEESYFEEEEEDDFH